MCPQSDMVVRTLVYQRGTSVARSERESGPADPTHIGHFSQHPHQENRLVPINITECTSCSISAGILGTFRGCVTRAMSKWHESVCLCCPLKMATTKFDVGLNPTRTSALCWFLVRYWTLCHHHVHISKISMQRKREAASMWSRPTVFVLAKMGNWRPGSRTARNFST